MADPFLDWFAALERRHLSRLTFREVRRGLEALSSIYVERRERLEGGAVFEGEGKKAAFALFYAPLHFLFAREVVRALGSRRVRSIVDLGCGTGAVSAAWASEIGGRVSVHAVDKSGWAITEARHTFSAFGIAGRVERGDLARTPLPSGSGVVVAYTANELDDAGRASLLPRLLDAGRSGPVLVLEPVSSRAVPWWPAWAEAVIAAGGRDDRWRFRVALPERLALLDRAAGLDHGELTGRSLWLAPGRT